MYGCSYGQRQRHLVFMSRQVRIDPSRISENKPTYQDGIKRVYNGPDRLRNVLHGVVLLLQPTRSVLVQEGLHDGSGTVFLASSGSAVSSVLHARTEADLAALCGGIEGQGRSYSRLGFHCVENIMDVYGVLPRRRSALDRDFSDSSRLFIVTLLITAQRANGLVKQGKSAV